MAAGIWGGMHKDTWIRPSNGRKGSNEVRVTNSTLDWVVVLGPSEDVADESSLRHEAAIEVALVLSLRQSSHSHSHMWDDGSEEI